MRAHLVWQAGDHVWFTSIDTDSWVQGRLRRILLPMSSHLGVRTRAGQIATWQSSSKLELLEIAQNTCYIIGMALSNIWNYIDLEAWSYSGKQMLVEHFKEPSLLKSMSVYFDTDWNTTNNSLRKLSGASSWIDGGSRALMGGRSGNAVDFAGGLETRYRSIWTVGFPLGRFTGCTSECTAMVSKYLDHLNSGLGGWT